MDTATLETLVMKALDYAEGACTFAFQGGEPTLVGLEFYKNLLALQKKYNTKNIQIHNALQTNGVVMNEEWADFLAKNKFLVGLSLDGPKEIHDAFRVDYKGGGSFNAVTRAAKLFDKYKVEYNILTVVNSLVARHGSKVYNFFKNSGYKYLQFITCLDPLGEPHGTHEFSLSNERYAAFLKTTFDLWFKDITENNYISIRSFDNYVGMAMGHPPESCGMSGVCSCYFVIESNGGVYPCDFYVLDEWLLGNIKETSFDELIKTGPAIRFVESSKHVSESCKACPYFPLCRGGCRRTKEPFENGKPQQTVYCKAYKEFFEYAGERIALLARNLEARS